MYITEENDFFFSIFHRECVKKMINNIQTCSRLTRCLGRNHAQYLGRNAHWPFSNRKLYIERKWEKIDANIETKIHKLQNNVWWDEKYSWEITNMRCKSWLVTMCSGQCQQSKCNTLSLVCWDDTSTLI